MGLMISAVFVKLTGVRHTLRLQSKSEECPMKYTDQQKETFHPQKIKFSICDVD